MTTSTYVQPDNPPDPEVAALDMIVRLPVHVLGDGRPPRGLLQELATALQLEGAFAGLSWHDARHAAVAVVMDFIARDDAAGFLLRRAGRAIDGSDGMSWDDPAAMSRAMTIGAKVVAS